MRVVFLGTGALSLATARALLEQGHDVIIIEKDRHNIDEVSEQLDADFLHGDGSTPAILREAGPETCHVFFAITENDQLNIIASVVARTLGFERVVTAIQNPEFEAICSEVGLTETIVPVRTVSRYLVDSLEGQDVLELSTFIKQDARFFSFIVSERDPGTIGELDLPQRARAVAVYPREGSFALANSDSVIEPGDEVVILTHQEHLEELRARWAPRSETRNES